MWFLHVFFMFPVVMKVGAMSTSLLPAPIQTDKVFCTWNLPYFFPIPLDVKKYLA